MFMASLILLLCQLSSRYGIVTSLFEHWWPVFNVNNNLNTSEIYVIQFNTAELYFSENVLHCCTLLFQPENVFVMCNGNSHLKLADFGFSYKLKDTENCYSCNPTGLFTYCFCVIVCTGCHTQRFNKI